MKISCMTYSCQKTPSSQMSEIKQCQCQNQLIDKQILKHEFLENLVVIMIPGQMQPKQSPSRINRRIVLQNIRISKPLIYYIIKSKFLIILIKEENGLRKTSFNLKLRSYVIQIAFHNMSISNKMAYNFNWVIPKMRNPSMLWGIASTITIAAVGLFSKILISEIYHLQIFYLL